MNYVLRALIGLLMLSTTVFTSVGHGKEEARLGAVAATYQNEAPSNIQSYWSTTIQQTLEQ